MKIMLSALALIFAVSAQASYLESCLLKTELKGFTNLGKLGESVSQPKRVLVAKVLETTDQGSHIGCDHHLDRLHVLETSHEDYLKLVDKKEATFDYFYVNGMTPTGVTESTRWTLVE